MNNRIYALNLGRDSNSGLEVVKQQYLIQPSGSTNQYVFSANGINNTINKLRLIYRSILGNQYNIVGCTESQLKSPNIFGSDVGFRGYKGQTETSVVEFSENGSCTIKYTYENNTRYIEYQQSGEDKYFHGTETTDESETRYTDMYLYTVVGMTDMAFGQMTFEPKPDTTEGSLIGQYSAGEYVLFAQPTVKGATTPNKDYGLISLADLNWNDGNGESLDAQDLIKKFHLTNGMAFGRSFNLFGGTLGEGVITAPVGSNGVKANIPQSCIAFRVNKINGDKKIRVIVAVPVSEFHIGESEYTLGNYSRYFNLWHLEEAGESTLQMFDAVDYIERFYIPRSHPYESGTDASDPNSEHIYVYPTSINDNDKSVTVNTTTGTKYRSYLNGDRVLVAYEFTVPEGAENVGIYVLGSSAFELDAKGDETETYHDGGAPMEIVYFSADGVASTGRDGESGAQMGTIDFVYDHTDTETNTTTVVTVKDSSTITPDGTEDYSTYYPSYLIPYFDNGVKQDNSQNSPFVAVNDEQLRLRRWIDNTVIDGIKSTMTFNKSHIHYTKLAPYANYHDIINEVLEPTP